VVNWPRNDRLKLEKMAERHALPADLTVAPAAAPGPDADHDFPTEVSAQRGASQVRRAASPTPPTSPATTDFSFEFPSEAEEEEEDATYSEPPAAVAAVPLVAAPPPRASVSWVRQPAWWIAALCAVLAIGEAGIITGRIPLRFGNRSSAVGTDARQGPQSASDARVGGDPSGSRPNSAQSNLPLGTAPPVPSSSVNPTALSQLEVTSDPPGARVTVDDRVRGTTPVTVSVSPGPHTVIVFDGTTTSKKTLDTLAGGTATFLASFAPATVSAGWVSIRSPLELQVREGDSLLGATSADRLMMPSGRHVLTLSNADAGFQTTLTVVVDAGKTATSTIAIPNGSLSLNALPWASVTIDGQALPGTTPFANLQVPLGPHEIVWTHPQLGERRQTVIVNAKTPVRLVVDLRVK
jgi:hypothetical protein